MRDAAVAEGIGARVETGCRMCGSDRLAPAGEVSGYLFVECGVCAYTFTPEVTPDSMAALYAGGYHGIHEGAPPEGWASRTHFLDPALDLLSQEVHPPFTLLDFGTGQSRIPDVLREQGHRVVAVDVAPPARAHADRATGDLLTLDLSGTRFDLAYSYQVFEHLPEPRPYLSRLLDLVRPGGYVLIHTDMEMPEREAGFEQWWYVLPPDHCGFFRHRTFEVALAGTPHDIVFRDAKRILVRVGT